MKIFIAILFGYIYNVRIMNYNVEEKEFFGMKNKFVAMLGAFMIATTLVPTSVPVQVFAAEAKTSSEITITYEDGCDGAAFNPVQIVVEKGVQIPDAGLSPERDGFLFKGWSPAVTGEATEDVTYIAQWVGDDSLTDNDRKDIAEEAAKTMSAVSVKDVNGKVASEKVGESVTPTTEPTVEPTTEPTVEPEITEEPEATAVPSEIVEPTVEVTVEPAGKQDSHTEDVETGDMNTTVVFGVAAVTAIVGGVSVCVWKKKQAE